MNHKGFTLVELLVTIAIIAIISGLVFPNLTGMISNNKTKKFEYYTNTLKEAAKLYIESYGEDVFYNKDCYELSFEELYKKSLIKDYNDNNTTCNTDKTYIKITKNSDEYKYEVSILCKAKDSNIEVYKKNNELSCIST